MHLMHHLDITRGNAATAILLAEVGVMYPLFTQVWLIANHATHHLQTIGQGSVIDATPQEIGTMLKSLATHSLKTMVVRRGFVPAAIHQQHQNMIVFCVTIGYQQFKNIRKMGYQILEVAAYHVILMVKLIKKSFSLNEKCQRL